MSVGVGVACQRAPMSMNGRTCRKNHEKEWQRRKAIGAEKAACQAQQSSPPAAQQRKEMENRRRVARHNKVRRVTARLFILRVDGRLWQARECRLVQRCIRKVLRPRPERHVAPLVCVKSAPARHNGKVGASARPCALCGTNRWRGAARVLHVSCKALYECCRNVCASNASQVFERTEGGMGSRA